MSGDKIISLGFIGCLIGCLLSQNICQHDRVQKTDLICFVIERWKIDQDLYN